MLPTLAVLAGVLGALPGTSASTPACAQLDPYGEQMVEAVKLMVAATDSLDVVYRQSVGLAQADSSTVVLVQDEGVCSAARAAMDQQTQVSKPGRQVFVVAVSTTQYVVFDPTMRGDVTPYYIFSPTWQFVGLVTL